MFRAKNTENYTSAQMIKTTSRVQIKKIKKIGTNITNQQNNKS